MIKNKKMFSLLIALFMVISIASPMLAEATKPVEKEGSLTIHKLYFDEKTRGTIDGTGGIQTPPANSYPLQGAEFSVWKTSPDAQLPNVFKTLEPQYKIVTDNDGLAKFENLPYGRYYVVETGLPKGVTQGSAPFLVDIPTTSVDGSELIKDVHVYPKNVLVLGAAKIHKMDEEKKGLPGAIFSLYKKGNLDELIASGITTGANGWTPVQENLEVGDYYFIETQAPTGYLLDGSKKEFTIGIGDHAYIDGALQDSKVKELHLTNFKKPGQPEKKVDKSNAGIGDEVTWTIKTNLPGNIKSYTKYNITDTLDGALNYVPGSLSIKLNGVELLPAAYTVAQGPGASGGTLELVFDPDALAAGELIITIKTIINEKAKVGVDIENQAILDYNNGFEEVTEPTNIVKVVVGGHKFIKKGNDNQVLKDAEFVVRREGDGKYLIKDAAVMITWGAKADAFKFVSDVNGKFSVDGVAYGTYFLEETKAPTGYSLLQNPIKFIVNAESYETELKIINKSKPGMPQTGGMGTLAFTAIGLAFMGIAAKTYKKEEK